MEENDILARRRKRVKRLKAIIVTVFFIMLITPTVLCAYCINKINRINDRLDELTDKINKVELSVLLIEQDMEQETATEAVTEVADADTEEPVEEETELKKIYLTFDDGPSATTYELLDVLDQYNVKATFFVTANKPALAHPEWYKEIVNRGHTIGMHSYSHVYKSIYATKEDFEADFNQIRELIKETTGVEPKYYRFPGGSSNTVSSVAMEDLCEYVESEGMEYFDWNVSSQDATSPAPRSSEIVNNVISGVMKNHDSIVLMHDATDKHSTIEALPGIIEAIQEMDNTVIVPIDDDTVAVKHKKVEE